MAKRNEPKGELFPRHIKALGWAIRQAESWKGGFQSDEERDYFQKLVDDAKAAMKEVRELGRQHASSRRRRPW